MPAPASHAGADTQTTSPFRDGTPASWATKSRAGEARHARTSSRVLAYLDIVDLPVISLSLISKCRDLRHGIVALVKK
jgi:hypothetical protein